jgi:uncharacterized membrane protein
MPAKEAANVPPHPVCMQTMSTELAYALAALFCNGIGDFIYKRAAGAGIEANHFLMGQAWLFCPATIIYASITGTLALTPSAIWGSVAGLLIVIGYYNYLRSLRSGSVSTIAPVFRLNFIVTAALAIALLGEPLTVRKVIALVLALASGWVLLGDQRASGNPQTERRSLVQVIVATVATGAAGFCYKLGLLRGATPETMLAAQSIVFCGLMTAMTFAMNGTVRIPQGFTTHSGPAAVVLIGAFLFLLHGLKRGEASVVVPIAQMGFVIAAVLGVARLGEAWTTRKGAGLCAAAISLVLLAVS